MTPRSDGRTPPPRVVAVIGAARAIGRSSIALNLAVAASQQGRHVCLLDAGGAGSPAAANAAASLSDVLAGRARLSDALRPGPESVDLLALRAPEPPSGQPGADAALLAHVDALEVRYDLVLADTPGGMSARALFFAAAATDVLVVVTPDAAVLRQTGTLLRVLATRGGRREFLVVANLCGSAAVATRVLATLSTLATRPPHARITPLGWIPVDDAMTRAGGGRAPVVSGAAATPAADALWEIAVRLVGRAPSRPTGGAQFFFQSLIAQGRAA